MTKIIKNTLLALAFIPLIAMAAIELNTGSVALETPNNDSSAIGINDSDDKSVELDQIRSMQASKIDKYFESKDLPLAGYGEQFVMIAEKYGLPYNLLPAIAMRESTGGKFACYNNPFGWGSCKIKFSSFEEAIESVGKNLGGGNPKTARYYANKSVKDKLYRYNGTVIKGYEDQVIAIMSKIDSIKIDNINDNSQLAINK